MHRSLLLLALPIASIACSSAAAPEAVGTSDQRMTEAWFATNLPHGSLDEARVLALVNDRGMSQADFVDQCHFSEAQASAIVAYRAGDEPATSADDQRFDDVAEVDRLPFTDAGFWSAAISCARNHTGPDPVCVHRPTVIDFVVDESGSMAASVFGGGPDKWTPTRDALLALIDKLETEQDPGLLVGLTTFSTSVIGQVKPRPLTATQADDLRQKIDTPQPAGGGTASAIALKAAYNTVAQVNGLVNPRRIVVFLSDGVPNGGATEQTEVLDLVTQKKSEGIETFAVGIGAFPTTDPFAYDPVFMGRIAQNGGTGPGSCDPASADPTSICHFQITPGSSSSATKNALVDAFRTINDVATGCP